MRLAALGLGAGRPLGRQQPVALLLGRLGVGHVDRRRPSIRTGWPCASWTTRPFVLSHRTSPVGRMMRNSMWYGSRPSTARRTAAITRSWSSGWVIAAKSSTVPPNVCGVRPWNSERRRPGDAVARDLPVPHAALPGVQHQPQPLLALAQGLLLAHLLAHLADDADRPRRPPRLVADDGPRHVHPDHLPSLRTYRLTICHSVRVPSSRARYAARSGSRSSGWVRSENVIPSSSAAE